MEKGMGLKQWAILVFLGFLIILGDSIYTLQSSFYPKVAASKNATVFQYTIVFGMFEATVAATSPIFGYIIQFTNPKSTFLAGSMLQAVGVVLFAFVDRLQNLGQFIGVSIALRVLEGIGLTAAFVGMYALIPALFPKDSRNFTMGIMDLCIPMAFLVGPLLGSVLYEVGGFVAPFAIIGGLILALSCFIPCIPLREKCEEVPGPRGNVLTLLKVPAIGWNFVVILITAAGFGVVLVTLEPFLRNTFATSQMTIGLIFGMTGLLYSIFSPLVGLLEEKALSKLPYIIFFGLTLDLIGTSIVGPLPFLWTKPNFVTTCIGMALFGCGTGVASFSAFLNAIREAKLYGFAENSGTLGLVSGLYISCYSIGAMISSPIAGLLYDNYGFRTSAYFPVTLILIAMIGEGVQILRKATLRLNWCGLKGLYNFNNTV